MRPTRTHSTRRSSQGRRVATFRGTDANPKETFVWTPAGVSGPGGNVGGALILRDRGGETATPAAWPLQEGQESRPERHYYCSDSRLSVVALVGLRAGPDGPTGTLAEQYRYSATGVPHGVPLGDVKLDGKVDKDDSTAAGLVAASGYQARADLDLDGMVDTTDVAIADAAAGAELGRGRLSVASVANQIVDDQGGTLYSFGIVDVVGNLYRPDIDVASGGGAMTPRPDGFGTGAGGGIQIVPNGNWQPPYRPPPRPPRPIRPIGIPSPGVTTPVPGPTPIPPAPQPVPPTPVTLPPPLVPNPGQVDPSAPAPPAPPPPTEPPGGWPEGEYGDCSRSTISDINKEIGRKCKSKPFGCRDLVDPVGDCQIYCDRADAGRSCRAARLRFRDECWRGMWPPAERAPELEEFPKIIDDLTRSINRCQQMCDDCKAHLRFWSP